MTPKSKSYTQEETVKCHTDTLKPKLGVEINAA